MRKLNMKEVLGRVKGLHKEDMLATEWNFYRWPSWWKLAMPLSLA